jgi:hypothetical protein
MRGGGDSNDSNRSVGLPCFIAHIISRHTVYLSNTETEYGILNRKEIFFLILKGQS